MKVMKLSKDEVSEAFHNDILRYNVDFTNPEVRKAKGKTITKYMNSFPISENSSHTEYKKQKARMLIYSCIIASIKKKQLDWRTIPYIQFQNRELDLFPSEITIMYSDYKNRAINKISFWELLIHPLFLVFYFNPQPYIDEVDSENIFASSHYDDFKHLYCKYADQYKNYINELLYQYCKSQYFCLKCYEVLKNMQTDDKLLVNT